VTQKIGNNSFIINSKAVLELESVTKGFLPPRLSVTQQTALGTTLPQGLLIYVIDGAHEGIQLWDGTKWIYYIDTAALALKANISSPTFTGTVGGITATMVGLGNVNNTSDSSKPISILTQAALDLKEDKINKITDINSDPTSITKYPSVSAVKNYVDSYNPIHSIKTIETDYTAERADYTILCNNVSAAFTLTLPDPGELTGKIYVIRKIDETINVLTINPSLKLTELTEISSLNYPKTIRVQSNGRYWYIID
ncbi:MAG: hypothetical protein ORN50_07770, partial [Crocinitomicaceae bacterium]|nr:hypothetical protein [Crocinitomicaceae bacterium]